MKWSFKDYLPPYIKKQPVNGTQQYSTLSFISTNKKPFFVLVHSASRHCATILLSRVYTVSTVARTAVISYQHVPPPTNYLACSVTSSRATFGPQRTVHCPVINAAILRSTMYLPKA